MTKCYIPDVIRNLSDRRHALTYCSVHQIRLAQKPGEKEQAESLAFSNLAVSKKNATMKYPFGCETPQARRDLADYAMTVP
jgi:hypothetical protein